MISQSSWRGGRQYSQIWKKGKKQPTILFISSGLISLTFASICFVFLLLLHVIWKYYLIVLSNIQNIYMYRFNFQSNWLKESDWERKFPKLNCMFDRSLVGAEFYRNSPLGGEVTESATDLKRSDGPSRL